MSQRKKVYVTTSWDDGHVLDMRLAGLLKKHNTKGTFYISPHDREFTKKERLNDVQIKALAKDFEIGAHTLTHPRLTTVSDAVAQREIQGSKRYLERLLHKKITSFCYPGGAYDVQHVRMVEQSGFRYARTVKRFHTGLDKKQPYEAHTTIHAYRHWSDVWGILRTAQFHPVRFAQFLLHWDKLAIALFEQVKHNGGVFHLWGHSWEIERKHDWQRLENVLSHIARSDLASCTNKELLS